MNRLIIGLYFLLLIIAARGQTVFPAALLDSISDKAYEHLLSEKKQLVPDNQQELYPSGAAAAFEAFEKVNDWRIDVINPSYDKSTDTLFVGLTPGDSLYITGAFMNDGPVLVYGDGILIFNNAQAFINGDIIVWGTTGRLEIINSTITSPQAYIYQRSMIAAGQAHINIENSTLNYSGLSHNLVITDSAKVSWNNVTKSGFTTCGMWNKAEIDIDGTPQAGEFIMMHGTKASFAHANTVLIWHHIPDTGVFNMTFPAGDTVPAFQFSNANLGVQGLYYEYTIDTCTDVMWGLMPEPGSQTHITNSELRTIGLWFKNQSGFQVSGLVNSSQYANFTAPLNDRNLVLVNTFVRTWSLYMFENAQGQVDNCIVGEIGVFGNSDVEVNNSMIDGSGGYIFAEDVSKIVNGFSYLSCDLQSKDNAFAFLAYGAQNWGRCIAMDKSLMFIIQSNLTAEPEFYNDAMVWYVKLEGGATLNTGAINDITGSAWIDKASGYYPIDFSHYAVDYKHADSANWLPVCGPVYAEVRSGVLGTWNTSGIMPGSYLLRLRMWDDTPDSNMVEALRLYNIQLLTDSKGADVENDGVQIYPNPASTVLNIVGEDVPEAVISVFDIHSNSINMTPRITGSGVKFDVSSLESGVYFIRFETRNKLFIKRVVLIK